MQLETGNARRIELGNFIGEGGEGRVFRVKDNPSLAVKLYKVPTQQREDKVSEMVCMSERKRPSSEYAVWPSDLLYERTGHLWWKKYTFVGYTMPYVASTKPIYHFYTPKMIRQHKWKLNWGHMHVLAFNLATVFKHFHDHELVIGDINSNNVVVNLQLVPIIIDVDSVQISPKHTSDVGVLEYIPPELKGRTLKNVVRSKSHDLFGLGYMIFQVLMGGCSPFAGVPKVDLCSERIDERCKDLGIFPFHANPYVMPPPGMPDAKVFHPEVTAGFIQCFIHGRKNPNYRPDAETWRKKLKKAEQSLIRCPRNTEHVYSSHLSCCPWCK